MSISSAMYAAVTGLSALSTGMQVISNNIANVNTVGFKAARTNFEDLISQDYWSNGRTQQIGRGVKVASVQQMFTQGSFINSAQDTDMAIAGEGFFMVRDRVTNELMYTRAGNFTFDANGVLETPAGYVLQGWELSVPKPGADPVRIGTPTDVKVITLNAPPVATTQIKVVCNLNADDSSAYIYSSAEFAEMYADQLAKAPAEAARISAQNAVYSATIHGTTFPSLSPTFNSAYIHYMSGNGYVQVSPGVFEKTVVTNPSTLEVAQAAASASAVAWATLSNSGTYPLTSNSVLYQTNYNLAYSNYMVNTLGYTEGPVGTFTKVSRTSPTTGELNAANSTAVTQTNTSNPPYTSYPSGDAVKDAVYITNYTTYLTSQGYTAPMDEYRRAANAAAMAAANTAGLNAGGDPGGTNLEQLKYAAAYAKELIRSGHTMNSSYAQPTLVTAAQALTNPTTLQQTAADNAAKAHAGISSYPDAASAKNLAYVAAYANYLVASGYTVSDDPTLAVPTFTTTPAAADAAAANAAGVAAASVLEPGFDFSTSTNRTAKLLYLEAYTDYLLSGSYTLASYTAPTLSNTDFTKQPTTTQMTLAENAGRAAALLVDTSYPGFATSNNRAADLAYADAYAQSLISQGFTIDSSYTPMAALPSGTDFSIGANSTEKTAADNAGKTAAIAAGAPANYSYPSGIAAEDTAYKTAYDNYMTTTLTGYTGQASITGFVKAVDSSPVAGGAEEQAALAAARAAGQAAIALTTGYPNTSLDPGYRAAYNTEYEARMTALGYTNLGPPNYFQKSEQVAPSATEVTTAQNAAKITAEAAAKNAGQLAYDSVYNALYQTALDSIFTQIPSWEREGMGFAGAWDGTNTESPIDPEDYTHANPWTIYDSLGTAHTLMVYYQPNPYMENVWDYLITCDPTEDARKDVNNNVVMNGATFAGVVQKGKITFTADGPDGHGGLVKDIEAQNLDMTKTAAARLTSASATVVTAPATASSINHYTFGGYYTGEPVFSATTGTLVATKREYDIVWTGNLGTVPDVSGFTWTDSDGNSGKIQVYDKNYTGPYTFGSGLTVNFSKGGTPMRFTVGDTLQVIANSEELGWTNLTPNEDGYFDFDLAFVQSASMALHPPYPQGLPTIIQHVALDMGARYNLAGDADGERWILDEQGTTQYASKSLNIFSSQDGYPPGSLQRVSIDKDGILTGIYTNGRHQPLYQIGLARFINPWGLSKLGDNVYMETRWSGTATLNPPGYGGTGTIRANFLEQSNTDLADEIVNMIVTQRGFQANTKVVTTTDTMLAEVIEMKR
ncbi:MAG: flagellar hook-basal body complex protein [Deltaproteobacteria bacterium]|jgi:flagellar hook-basal body protein|nr:flagellar hook-basal body complex protein [Deltaproteobacteria bacterium]